MLKQCIYCSNSIPLMPLCLKFKMAVSFHHHPSALAIFSKLASEISNIHFLCLSSYRIPGYHQRLCEGVQHQNTM